MRLTALKSLYFILGLSTASINLVNADLFDELDSETSSAPSSTQSFEDYKAAQKSEFNAYKTALMEEFDAFKKINAEEQEKYERAITEVWDTPVVSSETIWVEYSKDMQERKSVDFESGTVTIAKVNNDNTGTTNDASLRASVRALLEKNKAEAFRDDLVASAVEQRTKKELDPSMVEVDIVTPDAILIPYITGTNTASETVLDYIIDSMIAAKKTTVSINKQGKELVTTTLPINVDLKALAKIDPQAVAIEATMPSIPNALSEVSATKPAKTIVLPRAALPFSDHIRNYAQQAKMEPALLLAVMETESAFNPMAKSGVPAYGLMQIVPRSAGQDATAQLFGKPKILSPSYLYNSKNNIQVGATYLNILYYRYLKGVEDPLSRLYCSIAAYNTGAGNVAKAFTGERKIKPALKIINQMPPEQVYEHLRKNLPYAETQHYLVKVSDRLKKYGS